MHVNSLLIVGARCPELILWHIQTPGCWSADHISHWVGLRYPSGALPLDSYCAVQGMWFIWNMVLSTGCSSLVFLLEFQKQQGLLFLHHTSVIISDHSGLFSFKNLFCKWRAMFSILALSFSICILVRQKSYVMKIFEQLKRLHCTEWSGIKCYINGWKCPPSMSTYACKYESCEF